jgi:hypothetical protein
VPRDLRCPALVFDRLDGERGEIEWDAVQRQPAALRLRQVEQIRYDREGALNSSPHAGNELLLVR